MSSDSDVSPQPQPSGQPPQQVDTTMPLVVYGLYIAGFFTGGVTTIVGVIIAYVYQGKGPAWLDEHYRYQVRTFWIGFLYSVIALILIFVLIGFPLVVLLAVWIIVRCVIGFKALQEKTAPRNPGSWLW
ncbi:DUF4870 family protein [Kushneria aurantia]|uniref:DUF4870 family protein n=1 Tax=Kushneria aurantia TaxID=504092 RepID=A0ABV6FZG1_9GAMM|nr:DUF4870 domain-containing protein [Kushneria aurantia]